MALSIGIVGLPNVGKSTLFEALTQKQVDRANYPFATIDRNVGVVAVPDERIEKLAELSASEKKIFATVEFNDIAGLIEGAHKGEGLGNAFLSHIREVDAILYVLRSFKDPNIIQTLSMVDPIKEKEILETELALKDLETVEKRLDTVQKKAKSGSTKEIEAEISAVTKARDILSQGKHLINSDLTVEERAFLKGFQLLTLKPRLFLFNGNDSDVSQDHIASLGDEKYLVVNFKDELDVTGLTQAEKEEMGAGGLIKIISAAYSLLGLITFLTTGEKETRAWQVHSGATIKEAAGVIHTDFEKYFIKADVIGWDQLLQLGGMKRAREKGAVRLEGKEYIVKDGDVVEIRHGA